jgi:hypothetical protein
MGLMHSDSKGLEWQREKEWRIMRNFNDANNK